MRGLAVLLLCTSLLAQDPPPGTAFDQAVRDTVRYTGTWIAELEPDQAAALGRPDAKGVLLQISATVATRTEGQPPSVRYASVAIGFDVPAPPQMTVSGLDDARYFSIADFDGVAINVEGGISATDWRKLALRFDTSRQEAEGLVGYNGREVPVTFRRPRTRGERSRCSPLEGYWTLKSERMEQFGLSAHGVLQIACTPAGNTVVWRNWITMSEAGLGEYWRVNELVDGSFDLSAGYSGIGPTGHCAINWREGGNTLTGSCGNYTRFGPGPVDLARLDEADYPLVSPRPKVAPPKPAVPPDPSGRSPWYEAAPSQGRYFQTSPPAPAPKSP